MIKEYNKKPVKIVAFWLEPEKYITARQWFLQ